MYQKHWEFVKNFQLLEATKDKRTEDGQKKLMKVCVEEAGKYLIHYQDYSQQKKDQKY